MTFRFTMVKNMYFSTFQCLKAYKHVMYFNFGCKSLKHAFSTIDFSSQLDRHLYKHAHAFQPPELIDVSASGTTKHHFLTCCSQREGGTALIINERPTDTYFCVYIWTVVMGANGLINANVN